MPTMAPASRLKRGRPMDEPRLFDPGDPEPEPYPPGLYGGHAPREASSETSAEAADLAEPGSAKQRAEVLAYIAANAGVTDDDIAEALGIGGNSARPRRCELVELGAIVLLDREGRTRRGRRANRWVAAPPLPLEAEPARAL
jgi:hypothetical protein